jgi:hypothetical protein
VLNTINMDGATTKIDRMSVEVEFNITWNYEIEICFKSLSSEVTGTENKINTAQTITVNAKESLMFRTCYVDH